MTAEISITGIQTPVKIKLPSSKSISNRMLIIRHLAGSGFEIHNLSTAKDTETLAAILKNLVRGGENHCDAGPAGTTFRFLTAFLSLTEGTHFLTGSDRMKQRPVGALVDALRALGADISYTENHGFPPLKISGKQLTGGELLMDPSVSSQFVSALMLIAPCMENGLTLHFKNKPVSFPYIKMTAELMQQYGINVHLSPAAVSVKPEKYAGKNFFVEADWSSASYWYEIAALSEEAEIHLEGLHKNSLQADVATAAIFENFGVKTFYHPTGIIISREKDSPVTKNFSFDFENCPDIAQTVACTCAMLETEAELTGLQTLRIKETDRIEALRTELKKNGIQSIAAESSLIIKGPVSTVNSNGKQSAISNQQSIIHTYHDHRMALSFAPLALKTGKIAIENPKVVEKSYPEYWDHLAKAGFRINFVD